MADVFLALLNYGFENMVFPTTYTISTQDGALRVRDDKGDLHALIAPGEWWCVERVTEEEANAIIEGTDSQ